MPRDQLKKKLAEMVATYLIDTTMWWLSDDPDWRHMVLAKVEADIRAERDEQREG